MAGQKVVHIITRLDRGGSAQNTMLTILGHDRTQFEPVMVTGVAGAWDAQGGDRATAEHLRRLEKESIRYYVVPSLVRQVNPWLDCAALSGLIRVLRQERPALVHTHTSKAGVLGRIAAWIAGVPTIVHTPHGHVFYGHFGTVLSWFFLQIERGLARLTDCWLIGLTAAEQAEHLERGVGQQNRFAVIPSGIDVERFKNARASGKVVPDWFQCPPAATVIGSVGWLTDIKGHQFLVDAVGFLKYEFPSLHLVIVGSGDQHEALLSRAQQAGINERVHFIGHRDDIEMCLAGMDCFVLPSLNEGMGRALIEAMAAGLPVIASQVGGIPALIKNGENGVLTSAGDSRSLADALQRVLRDPIWAEELGTNARQTIDSHYGVTTMVQSIESWYRKAMLTHA